MKIYIMLNIYLLLLAMLFRKMENLFENFVKDFEHVCLFVFFNIGLFDISMWVA